MARLKRNPIVSILVILCILTSTQLWAQGIGGGIFGGVLLKSGGDMRGNINMGSNKITFGTGALQDQFVQDGSGGLLLKAYTAPPATGLTATAAAGAGVTAGTHSYKVTFVTAGGETDAGVVSNQVTTAAGNLQVNITALPVGNQYVTARKIYRTVAGDTGSYLLQQTVANNTATTATDNTADGALGAAIPTTNNALDTRLSIVQPGPIAIVTGADFTDASSNALQNIPALTWTLPANTAATYTFRCDILYNQTVAAVADSFGIKATGLNPTNIKASGWVQTAATTIAYGNLPTLNTQTATDIIAFTPSAITTVWQAHLEGVIENPSGAANTINIMVKQSTAGDLIVIKRGSYCVMGF